MKTLLALLLLIPNLSWGSSIILKCDDVEDPSKTFFIKDDIFYLDVDYPLKLYKSDVNYVYYKDEGETFTTFAQINRYDLLLIVRKEEL